MTMPDPQASPSSPQDPAKVTVPEVPSADFSIPDAPEVEAAAEIPAPEVPAFETAAEISVPDVPSFEAAAEVSAPEVLAPEVPAPEVPAPEAPTFPQASAPSFDEATATPGSTTYGTAYDVPAADAYAQAEQPAYGVPGPETNSQAPYGQPGFEQAAYAAGQQAYGQPGYAQTAYAQPVVAGAPKQWMVALLLGIFLGGFGIHNFYLGYTTRGIIQLVLTITVFGAPITGVWVLIELIMILMRSGSYAYDAQGVPLQ
ncbi:NINE protein [Schaalia odontolytica]|uniref:TM2 domain-containing protein n=1 Tax=Schaalia odontolytica TaxID=1660 RepID=UPI003C712380